MKSAAFFFCVLASAQVPYERIVKASSEPGNWLTYSGNYEAHRFSPLAQLTPANVSGLKTIWTYQARTAGRFETTPLVFDGVMYITEPPTVVVALDLKTGRPLWRWERRDAAIHASESDRLEILRQRALGDMIYV